MGVPINADTTRPSPLHPWHLPCLLPGTCHQLRGDNPGLWRLRRATANVTQGQGLCEPPSMGSFPRKSPICQEPAQLLPPCHPSVLPAPGTSPCSPIPVRIHLPVTPTGVFSHLSRVLSSPGGNVQLPETVPGKITFISKYHHDIFLLTNPCAALSLLIPLSTLDINTIFNVSKIYRSVSKTQIITTTSAHLPASSITHMAKKHSGREKNKFWRISQATEEGY